MDIVSNIFIISLLILAFVIILGVFLFRSRSRIIKEHRVKRHEHNPVLSPLYCNEWESRGTFNPAVVEDNEGRVHLFYRAIGEDGLSRIGYASSEDGVHFNERSPYPVFQPSPGFGLPDADKVTGPAEYNPLAYPSGGGWGGCEDPKAVRIKDRVYMTYTSFESWDNMRIGLTSISQRDLKNRRWNWKRPSLISPPKKRNKNWVLFPEKINGKYAILHSVSPKVLIAYLDNLERVPVIESSPDHGGYGIHDKVRELFWDKIMKGAGPPPLKTDIGWLVLYHAIGDNRYNLGVMILDLQDPTKILYRAPSPILLPDMWYENDWKPGIVYACGAIVKGGQLMVYYGGGDKYVCVAETDLKELLEWLKEYGKV